MVEPDKMNKVMGGVLNFEMLSVGELAELVSEGLPKVSLRNTVRRLFDSPAEANELMHRIVPEATYKRRRTRLTSAESERTERLARVIASAEVVWDDRDAAKRWLLTPHPELNGKRPLDASLSELGARQVEDLLDRIYYGIPT
jgi:putative toxin-antitoxin system antitoxin component (TIGR02293 family)